MNDLYLDISYDQLHKAHETLCGDHVQYVQQDHHALIVLADGLGSGVKASILSTLTAKIISTLLLEKVELKEIIDTIAHTLPVCKTRQVAYSTFSWIEITHQDEVHMVQYDNPSIILMRDGMDYKYDKEEMLIEGKRIYLSHFHLKENDVLMMMTDGCVHAGIGKNYNFGWEKEDILSFLKKQNIIKSSANELCQSFLKKCDELYDHQPGDDATCVVIKVIKRVSLQVLIGPPKNRFDNDRMLNLYFSKKGIKVVCGGTTSQIVSRYLNKPIETSLNYIHPDIPPIAKIEGIDLVTEGVITINRVLEYLKDMIHDNQSYQRWSHEQDGASLLARLLIERATDIHFFVGCAINPSHQNPDLPIQFHIKMQLIETMSELLKTMHKHVNISYF